MLNKSDLGNDRISFNKKIFLSNAFYQYQNQTINNVKI